VLKRICPGHPTELCGVHSKSASRCQLEFVTASGQLASLEKSDSESPCDIKLENRVAAGLLPTDLSDLTR
jgi:hypothetical protein